MTNAQKWLDEKYPSKQRSEIRELDISSKDLEEKLILTGFNNLKKLNCSHNKITSLDLTDSSKSLEELIANDNQLSRLVFNTNDPTNLKTLNLVNNNFHNNRNFWNFTFLFRSLKSLDLRNSGIKKELVDYVGYIDEFKSDGGEEWKEKGMKFKSLSNYLESRSFNRDMGEEEKKRLEKEYRQVQVWLDFNYPKEERDKVKELIINGELEINGDKSMKLEGNLDLKEFTSLEKLNIQFNWGITGCDITGLSNLTYLCVCQTQIKEIDFSASKDKLTEIYFNDCNFSEQDLSIFQNLPKLQHLQIRNYFREPEQQKQFRNRFKGSLELLKTSSKLEELHIDNTDISKGLEYLPKNVELVIYCSTKLYPESLCKELQKELEPYEKEGVFYDYQAWRKNNQELVDLIDAIDSREWLNQNYPQDGESTRKIDKENYGKKREDVTKLSISGKKLKGSLKLEGFINLEKLDCSDNFLTNLDLSSCPKLISLDCSDNSFTDISFLQSLPNKGQLEELGMQKSIKFSDESKLELDFLKEFKGLVELNVEYCPFEGSLKHLSELKNLKKIYISHTDLREGIEDLPESCKEIYCDFHYKSKHKSVKIAKELGRHLETGDETKYYDLAKWKEEQRSGIVSVIPLERLYVIRGNMKKFLDKWGERTEDNWYERNEKRLVNFLNPLRKTPRVAENLMEMSKLKHPNEFSRNWWLITSIQWANRATSVVGGSLLLVGQSDTENPNSQIYTQTGGVIAIAAPFIETVTSYINEQVYDSKQRRWDEFERDVENLWDNFYELIGIIEPVKDSFQRKAKVDKALSDLNKAVYKFLEEYDEDKNEQIDIDELKIARGKLTEDLRKKWEERDGEEDNGKGSKLNEIVEAIRGVEKGVTEYRKAFYRWVREEEEKKLLGQKKREAGETSQHREKQIIIDLEENEQGKLNEFAYQVETSPK